MGKKLLIGLTYYYPNTSGLSHYAKILAENLVGRGWQVAVICSRHERNLKKEETINGVRIKRMDGFRLGKGFIMLGYWLAAVKLVKNNEVVNCHLPSLEAFWLAIGAKIWRKRLVATYHCYFDSGNKIVDRLIYGLQYLICSWADKIVVNTKDYIIGNGLLRGLENKLVEIYPPL